MKALIALLTAATGILHLLVGFNMVGGSGATNWILVLNGVGYLVLLWLFWTSSGSRRGTIRWILLAYTLITLVGYVILNGSAVFQGTPGLPATEEKRHDNVREHDDVAQRQDRIELLTGNVLHRASVAARAGGPARYGDTREVAPVRSAFKRTGRPPSPPRRAAHHRCRAAWRGPR